MERRQRMRLWIALTMLAICACIGGNAAFAAKPGPSPQAIPMPPLLSSPPYGSNVGGTSVSFLWGGTLYADYYCIQVDLTSAFQNPAGTCGITTNSYTMTGFSDKGYTYYWHVRGVSNTSGSGNWSAVWYFVNGPSAVPATPTLVTPASGALVNGTTVIFGWNETARATDYRLQMAYDANFTQMSYNYLVASWMYWTGTYWAINVSGFPDDGSVIYWRVQAQNSRGTSPFSATRQFTNGPSAVPATPTLAVPANGAIVNGTSITFGWYDTARAADYRLQAAYDSAFTQIGYNNLVGQFMTWNGSYWVVTITNFPDDGSVIYWRVQAQNSRGLSPFSATWQFTNGPSAVPATPILNSPLNGANVPGTVITFKWDDTPRAADFRLQIATDAAFTQVGYDNLVGQYIYWSGGFWAVDVPQFPDNGQVFYWRVQARNSKGSGPFSASRQVINGPSAVPVAPVLQSPANGSVALGATITFTWNAAARAADYHLVVARDGAFASILFDQWVGNVLTWNVPGFLGDDQQYYWRVTARNSMGSSGDSPTWTFNNAVGACSPVVGTGNGLLYAQTHIDTCYDAGAARYYLVDVSRRANTTADHTHLGRMSDSAVIQTSRYVTATSAVTVSDADNYWIDFAQASGVDAQVHTGWVYDYINLGLGLNSFDRAGSSMRSLVEVPNDVPNAWWFDDISQVWYTSQIGPILPLSGAVDLVGHVWGYAVTDRASGRPLLPTPWSPGVSTRGLFNGYESGALAVSFSDMLGTAVEQSRGEINWTIGEGIWTIRDMQNPPSYAQPDTYNGPGYFATAGCTPSDANDFCGVHTNSGVPNKMFYLLAAGGTHNNIAVEGLGTQAAMGIALTANLTYWGNAASFQDARAGMESAASLLYPLDSSRLYQVRNAWAAVGIGTVPIITVSADPAEGGSVSGGGSYPWGASAMVRATANSGYRFVNWTENGVEVSTDYAYAFTVNGARTLTAHFAVFVPNISVSPTADDFGHFIIGQTSPAHTFTVTNSGDADLVVGGVFLSGGDSSQFAKGLDSCSGAVLPLNQTCQIAVTFSPTSTGAKQTNLYIPSNDPDTPLLGAALTGTGDAIPTFTITASAEPGGTINPAGTFIVNVGATKEFTIAAYTGFRILDVLVDGSSVGAPTTYTFSDISADHTIKATFAVLSYTITASAGPGGSITPSGSIPVNYGGSQTFTFSAVSGASVLDVLVDGASVGAVTSYTFSNVQADHSIQVSFGSILFVGRTGTGSGTVTSDLPGINCPGDCNEKYPYGTVVTLTATPNAGSSFTGWSSACGGTSTCTLTMTALRLVIATFIDIAPPVTTASPAGGTYASAQTVSLTCSDTGSGCRNIYYTTDGTTPTTASSVYSGPILISTPTTLQYFATDVAGNVEAVNTQVYDFYPPASGVTLAADPLGPATLGIKVTFTAAGIGGSGSYEYQYLLKLSTDTTWTTARAYSTASTWLWDTSLNGVTTGTYNVMVQVRNVGSVAASEASQSIDYTLTTSSGGGGGPHRR